MAGDALKDRDRAMEWKVYYEPGSHHEEQPGREVPINKTFSWGKQTWYLPAVYLCEKGLVMDLCVRGDIGEVKAFIEKWLPYELHPDRMSEELRELSQRENPLRADVRAALRCNGTLLRESRAQGNGWFPDSCAWDGWKNSAAARRLLEHYGLNKESPWSFTRIYFPWEGQEGPQELRELSLCLEARPVSFTAGRFEGAKEGREESFHHPLSGKVHALTVIETEKQELPETAREGCEYPRTYLAMHYTVTPDLPREALRVLDRSQGDKVRKQTDDGPVAVLSSAVGPIVRMGKEHEPRTAISSLYFELPEDLEWRIVLREKLLEDMEIRILP